MIQLLGIAAGGALGAVLRFLLSTGINASFGSSFPLGTLVVNVLGSGAMGFLFIIFAERMHVAPELRLALTVGLLGAFTTFSTFSVETVGFVQAGELAKALFNIFASVVLCAMACWGGMVLGRAIAPGTI